MRARYSWSLALLIGALAAGCDGDPGVPDLVVISVDSTGNPVVTIDADEGRVVERALAVERRLHRDLVIVPEAVNVLAVSPFPDGRIAVLDDREGTVYTPDGSLLYRFGRRGRGPGELSAAFALAATAQGLVVTQALSTSNGITVFDPNDGRLRNTASPPMQGGDWEMRRMRGPTLFTEFPHRTGPERWSARIRPLSESTVVAMIQEKEILKDIDGDSALKGEAFLLRMAIDGSLVDTVAALDAAPSHVRTTGDELMPPILWEPLFSPRPRWAAGDGWIAYMGAKSGVVEVVSERGRHVARIIVERGMMDVREDHRRDASKFAVEYIVRAREDARRNIERLSWRQRRDAWQRFRRFLTFSPATPVISAVLGAGQCVLLGLFATDTYLDGTGRVWLRIDIRNGTLIDVPGVAVHDVAVLAADWRGVYGREYGNDDRAAVVRWTFGDDRCL